MADVLKAQQYLEDILEDHANLEVALHVCRKQNERLRGALKDAGVYIVNSNMSTRLEGDSKKYVEDYIAPHLKKPPLRKGKKDAPH